MTPLEARAQRHKALIQARGRLNALQRYREPDDPAIADARHELAIASVEAHVAKVIANAPPLTAEQVERLRALLPAPAEAET